MMQTIPTNQVKFFCLPWDRGDLSWPKAEKREEKANQT